jgi:hypothetical protein
MLRCMAAQAVWFQRIDPQNSLIFLGIVGAL